MNISEKLVPFKYLNSTIGIDLFSHLQLEQLDYCTDILGFFNKSTFAETLVRQAAANIDVFLITQFFQVIILENTPK